MVLPKIEPEKTIQTYLHFPVDCALFFEDLMRYEWAPIMYVTCRPIAAAYRIMLPCVNMTQLGVIPTECIKIRRIVSSTRLCTECS